MALMPSPSIHPKMKTELNFKFDGGSGQVSIEQGACSLLCVVHSNFVWSGGQLSSRASGSHRYPSLHHAIFWPKRALLIEDHRSPVASAQHVTHVTTSLSVIRPCLSGPYLPCRMTIPFAASRPYGLLPISLVPLLSGEFQDIEV